MLTKADWEAVTKAVPPKFWKTGEDVSYVVRTRWGKLMLGVEAMGEQGLTQDEGSDGGEISGLRIPLGHDDGHLVGQPPADTGDDLVPDPLPGAGADAHGVDQAAAHERDGAPDGEHGHRQGAFLRDEGTRGDHADGHGDDERDVVDAGHDGADVADALEVDGQVVQDHEVAAGEEAREQRAGADGPGEEQPRHDDSPLALVPLPRGEEAGEDEEGDEQRDDLGPVPGLGLAAVLQRQHEADEGAHDEGGAHGVHLEEALAPGGLDGRGVLRRLEEDEDDEGGEPADGQVDVEAPAPGRGVGEGAADEWAAHAGDAVAQTDEAGVHGPLGGGRDEGDDGVGARADTGGA